MKCVFTGARVFIYELGAIVAADVYSVGQETLVIRWNERSLQHVGPIKARELGATHFVMEGHRQGDDWCREDIAVMVTHRNLFDGELHE
jgi:hypothetical protein